MKGGALYKPKKRQDKPPKESKKRSKEKIYYKQHCKELEDELRAKDENGKIYDFFSGDEIKERISWHHWYGRTGDWYADKAGLIPTINKNHLMFHHLAVEKLEEQPWYSNFLDRLKLFDEKLWEKQVNKKQKSNRLNYKLFDEDEID